jgi:hypothetical protein
MKPEGNYTIGRGKLIFKAEGQSNFADLGNCPDFKFTVKTTETDHYSSRSGFKKKDDSAITEQDATGSFTLDDLMDENMRMFFMANAVTDVAQVQGTVSGQAVTAELDKWIELGKRKISNVVVKAQTPSAWQAGQAYDIGDVVLADACRAECTAAGTSDATEPVWTGHVPGDTITDGTVTWTIRKLTYVPGTDYILDTEVGLIQPISEGEIKDAQVLAIDFSHAAITVKKISAATARSIVGHLWFVGDPPKGKILDIKGYASLVPNGDFAVIGDNWTNFGFNVTFQTNEAYGGLYDVIDRGTV